MATATAEQPAFVVSARKYRPSTFASVVGQSHITTTLKNAIASNHLAQAFLFCGPRGVGKTTCARILAKAINCQNRQADAEPCNQCDSCRSFNENASFNIHELDAASNNSVDDIRQLVEQVRYPPHSGQYKVYIIDEVHMLSTAAFNAFLKTLEEPPSYAIFILATTEKHKIIPTILSRCQIFDFARIKVQDIVHQLEHVATSEGIKAEEPALHVIAQKADGGMRDALSMFDLVSTFSPDRSVTYDGAVEHLNVLDYDYYFKILEALEKGDSTTVLLTFDDILRKGFDGGVFLSGLAEHLRNVLLSRDPATAKLLQVPEGVQGRYHQQAWQVSPSFLLTALNLISQSEVQYKNTRNQRLLVEICLLKVAHLQEALSLVRVAQQGNGTLPTAAPAAEKKNDQPVEAGADRLRPPGRNEAPGEPITFAANTAAEPNGSYSNSSGGLAAAGGQRPPLQNAPKPPPGMAMPKMPGKPGAQPAATPEPTWQPDNPATNPQTVTRNAEPVTDASLAAAIVQLTAELKANKEHFLAANYLATSQFELREPETVVIKAPKVAMVDFNKLYPVLRESLMRHLSNDTFLLVIEESEAAPIETGNGIYSDTERMNYLLTQYPEFQEWRRELGLDLAYN